jgi:uncharacterized protein YfkK (UPF0435 family)
MDNDFQNKQLETVPEDKISEYKAVKSSYSDFGQFEDINTTSRAESKRRFIENIDYVPDYQYPKLKKLKDVEVTIQKKTDVYNAVLELEVARKAADIIGDNSRSAELQLYRSFHDVRLKKIMLAEAAQHLHDTATSADQETARKSFLLMNQEVYGEINQEWFIGMLNTEYQKSKDFQPTDTLGTEISGTLSGILKSFEGSSAKEPEVISEDEMQKLHEFVLRRYDHILSEVPDTDDGTYYGAQQCSEIINKSLSAGGLADEGWSCTINPSKSNPTTNGSQKKIFLPSATRRTANELRRLIAHEQEMHARRAQNGRNQGSELLASGTADYADVEEGGGVMLECAVAGNLSNPSFNRARERYITAGLALGLDNGAPRDAREVYEILWRMIAVDSSQDGSMPEPLVQKAKDKAYLHVENAFRGTDFWMKGVIYTKLKVYYEGLIKNARYFADNINNLDAAFDDAMIGKLNHTDPDELEQVKVMLGSPNRDE